MNRELITSRETVPDGTVWMVAADERGLGLESCRCGQSVISALTKYHGSVIEIEFSHEDGQRCMAAFTRDKFQPLSFVEYRRLLGHEVDDGD